MNAKIVGNSIELVDVTPEELMRIRGLMIPITTTPVSGRVRSKSYGRGVKHRKWTAADKARLGELYSANYNPVTKELKRKSANKIARMIGRTRLATSVQICKLGLSRKQ